MRGSVMSLRIFTLFYAEKYCEVADVLSGSKITSRFDAEGYIM